MILNSIITTNTTTIAKASFIAKENQNSNLCPNKALCQLPCKDILQAHCFLSPDDVYCELTMTKDFCTFFAKKNLKKNTFLFGTNRSQRCILLFSSLKIITKYINN